MYELISTKSIDKIKKSQNKHKIDGHDTVKSHKTSPEVDCENLDLPQNQDDELPQITSAPSVEVQTPSPETEDTEQPQPSSSCSQDNLTDLLIITLRLQ